MFYLLKNNKINFYRNKKIILNLVKNYNLYLVNNNGARIFDLDYAKKLKKYKWIFVLDGNSFFTKINFYEPRICFRNTSNINFNPLIPYDSSPKAELLRVLNIQVDGINGKIIIHIII